MFLAAHGHSRRGTASTLGHACFAALVHVLDDENALWEQQVVGGTHILRKAMETNHGLALTGLCFPEHLYESSQSPDLAVTWRALPYQNVVVRETSTKQAYDQHVLWTFVPENTQDDISMDQAEGEQGAAA